MIRLRILAKILVAHKVRLTFIISFSSFILPISFSSSFFLSFPSSFPVFTSSFLSKASFPSSSFSSSTFSSSFLTFSSLTLALSGTDFFPLFNMICCTTLLHKSRADKILPHRKYLTILSSSIPLISYGTFPGRSYGTFPGKS